MFTKDDFNAAMARAGGLRSLADAVGEKNIQTVFNWRSRGVPANKCKAFAAATGARLQDLRDDWADYWPELRVHDRHSA